MKRRELLAKLKKMDVCGAEKKKITCVLIGHSKIITTCFGYIYCSRCEDQIGDSLAGVFDGGKHVIVGHDCSTCRENYKNLTWEDKLYAHPDPLNKKGAKP